MDLRAAGFASPATAAIAAAMVLATGGHAFADAWVPGTRSAVRVVAAGAGTDAAGPYLRAGIEIRLDPGWKTYWRYPGDAGIPPRFGFGGSANLAHADVAWPAPRRLAFGTTTSIGYAGAVVFPVTVRPQDPARPVKLALRLDYAVCEQICIPVSVHVPAVLGTLPPRTTLAASGPALPHGDARLALFEARVPRRAALGAPGPLAITQVAVDRTATPWRVTVEAVAPPDADLFVEGPDDGWTLPVPTPLPDAGPGRKRFAFALDGVPAGQDPVGAPLTFTLTGADAAIEVTTPLDAAGTRAK